MNPDDPEYDAEYEEDLEYEFSGLARITEVFVNEISYCSGQEDNSDGGEEEDGDEQDTRCCHTNEDTCLMMCCQFGCWVHGCQTWGRRWTRTWNPKLAKGACEEEAETNRRRERSRNLKQQGTKRLCRRSFRTKIAKASRVAREEGRGSCDPSVSMIT